MTSFRRVLSLAAAVSLLAGPAAPQSRGGNKKMQTRQLFVAVTDNAGQPVLDVAPTEFDVTEAGVKRTVTHAALATNPMRVALMVDTSEAATAALTHMRNGLLAFLDTLEPQHEVMLVSTGRQMRVRVQSTADRKKVKDAAGSLFPDGAGTPLMDALQEVDKRFMSKGDDRWPVFVLVTSDGTESSAGAGEKEFNRWIDNLRYRNATVHAIVLNVKDGRGLPDIVARNATNNTGGHYESIILSSALPDKLKALATQMNADFQKMATRYQIDFETDTVGALADISAGISREKVKMQVSYQRRFP
jgi:hypothetical protein